MAYRLTPADQVWNRACEGGGADPGPGDRALTALLYAHGMIMNGGVFHVFETLETAELDAAKAGYRYFGLAGVAELIDRAGAIPDGEKGPQEDLVDGEYLTAIGGSDAALGKHFEAHFAKHPEAYRPV